MDTQNRIDTRWRMKPTLFVNSDGVPGPAMRRFWRRQYVRLLRATWETFGLSDVFFRILWGKPTAFCLDTLFFALDPWIYPDCVKQPVVKPVFIIGHPRSGTTMLHRFINSTGEFACFQSWEMILSALTARKLFGRLFQAAMRSKRNVLVPAEAGHEQRLDSVEEEELLWFKYLSTQFVYVYTPLGFSEEPWDDVVFRDRQDARLRHEWMAYLKGCFQRHIYWKKKHRIVANMNYMGMGIKTLIGTFPDARIIYVDRPPEETIPSHLTLDFKVLDYLWDLKRIPGKKVREYLRKRYMYDVHYYRYINQLRHEGFFDVHDILQVPYEDIRKDFRRTIWRILEFAELPVSESMRRRIEEQHERQWHYRPVHSNLKLEDFGFSLEGLAKDLSGGDLSHR